MDIYFFSTIINIIWYIFTILFVLYRFTTFFSWAWNFLIFLGNLISCFKWVGNKVHYIYNYYYNGYRPPFQNSIDEIDEESNPYEPLLDKNEKSMIMKVKDNIVGLLPNNWFKGKKEKGNHELYELYISELNTMPKFTKRSKSITQTSFEHAHYDSTIEWGSPSSSNNTNDHPLENKINNDNNIHFPFENSNMLLESKFINEFYTNKNNSEPAILQLTENS